jgi:hypothetical protein
MKNLSLFWWLFLFFWAVPFPMIMYYPMSSMSAGSPPMWAFIWLGLSLILWILLLRAIFRGIVLKPFSARQNLANLMKNGDLLNAKIISSTKLQQEIPGIDKYQLGLELQNFVGTPIHETINLNDNNPLINRFTVGKTIQLRIDKTLKNVPYLQMDGAHYDAPSPKSLIGGTIIWLFIVAIVAGYYVYAYQHQNNGTGWRFLVFWHPLVLSPLILLAMSFFSGGGKLSKNQLQHKYYGLKTTANVISVSQTGVYVNNQPQVKFELQYTDRSNRLISVTFTKIISLLNVGISQQKAIDIFYLQNDPQNICLASDLESQYANPF